MLYPLTLWNNAGMACVVEEAALAWLEALGYAVLHGPDTDNRPEQKTMANSTQQARNIDGSLAINGQPLPAGTVLLVDDMVGSRWTLTVAAWLLRSHGSGEVLPLALALTGHEK